MLVMGCFPEFPTRIVGTEGVGESIVPFHSRCISLLG